MGVLNDLAQWIWRLIPANPILVRVVTAGGKRARHLAARVAYLSVLCLFMIFAQWTLTRGGSSPSLASLAKDSTQIFMLVSVIQLGLMCFVAPIFAAAAITQEKDSNTFNILLTTPLSDGQIVLGSLLSRLYFVWVLLLSGLPVFCINMIYGGVTLAEVFYSFALAACTALLTGSAAIAISMLKVGTQRTIFSFFVGIAVYLLGVFLLARWPATQVPEAPPPIGALGTPLSWLAPFHPFLALFAITGQTPTPAPEDVAHYPWPWDWLAVKPHLGYVVFTTLASAAILAVSLFAVRRAARTAEASLIERWWARLRRKSGDEPRRKPRRVWSNPIAWREAMTRGSGAGQSRLRWLFVGSGIAVAAAILIASETGAYGLTAAGARASLTAVIWIEMAVILLVVTNTSAATLTRERDAQTLDLLLTTPLTSRYIIAGMLRGLVSFVTPMIAVPTFTLLLFVVADLGRAARGLESITTPESVILAPLLLVAFASAAAMIGLNQSLKSRKTVHSVMVSTAIVLGATGGAWLCGYWVALGGIEVAAVFSPLSPFQAIHALIDPRRALDVAGSASASQLINARILRSVLSLVSAGIYVLIVVVVYNSLVTNFDMTIRKQSV